MQTERTAKEKWEKRTFLFIAEMQLILCKDNKKKLYLIDTQNKIEEREILGDDLATVLLLQSAFKPVSSPRPSFRYFLLTT